MAEKDIAEKILEGWNDVFADIVNVTLFNGEQVIRPEDLEDQTARSVYKADGKLREMERDVAKRWKKNNIRTEQMHVQETLQMLSVLTGDRRFEDVLNEYAGERRSEQHV